MKTAVVFIHNHHVGAGEIPYILQEHGFTVDIRFTPKDDLKFPDPDLLVVMGGPQGAYEADQYPYLQTEINILQKRLAADKPTLGICLGAQLMAAALKARVYKGKQGPEIGWFDINVNVDGAKHPVRHLGALATKMMQWHGDTFDLAAGATLLASSDLYRNQIFSYGKNALALQCHPEVDEKLSAQWISEMDENDIAKSADLACEKARLLEDTVKYNGKLVTQMRAFMKDWLASIGL